MFLDIINYFIRGLFIVLGILFLSGVIFANYPEEQQWMVKFVGVLFILWGVYRIIMYRLGKKRHYYDNED